MHQRGRGADGIVDDHPRRVHPDHQLLVLIQPLHRRRPVSLASSASACACVQAEAGSEPWPARRMYIKQDFKRFLRGEDPAEAGSSAGDP